MADVRQVLAVDDVSRNDDTARPVADVQKETVRAPRDAG
jgi:hypothetical protein